MIDGMHLHYEHYGAGAPVLLLHGTLGSWRFWMPAMEALSSIYRTYALDLWGFGDSDRSAGRYSIGDYVLLVEQFLANLGIVRADIVGHGIGGIVALQLAARRPESVHKLVLVSTPFEAQALSPLMRSIAQFGVAHSPFLQRLGGRLLERMLPAGKHECFHEVVEDTLRVSRDVTASVVASLGQVDYREEVDSLQSRTLAIYGSRDNIVDANQSRIFSELQSRLGEQQFKLITFEGCKHFPMLDDPPKFNRLLLDYLESSSDSQPLKLKRQWRRRTSMIEYLEHMPNPALE